MDVVVIVNVIICLHWTFHLICFFGWTEGELGYHHVLWAVRCRRKTPDITTFYLVYSITNTVMSYVVTAHTVVPLIIQIRGSVLITHARSLKLVKWWLADCWMSGVEGGGTLSYPAGCSGLSLTHTVGFLDHISQGSQGGQALASWLLKVRCRNVHVHCQHPLREVHDQMSNSITLIVLSNLCESRWSDIAWVCAWSSSPVVMISEQ